MKRKQIEKLPQRKVKKIKGYVCTAARLGNYLVIDVWRGDTARRYAIDVQTGEYGCLVGGEWRNWKFANLIGFDGRYGYYATDGDFRWDTEEDQRLAFDSIKWNGIRKYGRWCEELNTMEEEYIHNRNLNAKEREYDRIQKTMALIPEPGDALKAWVMENCCPQHYLFYLKEEDSYRCSRCGVVYPRQQADEGAGIKLKHGMITNCAACGLPVTVDRRRSRVTYRGRVMQLMSVDNAPFQAACHYKYEIVLDRDGIPQAGRGVYLEETVRLLLWPRSAKKACTIYYSQNGGGEEWWTGLRRPEWYTRNPYSKRCLPCYLYPKGIRNGLAGTAYEDLVHAFEEMADLHIRADYNAAMAVQANNSYLAGVLEYLVKGRFRRLAQETMDKCDHMACGYYGPLHIRGRNAQEVLGLKDRQKVNRLREENGGNAMLLWLRYTEMIPQYVSHVTLAWLSASDVSPGDVTRLPGDICHKMTLEKIAHYLERQIQGVYRTPKEALEQWADYLSMMEGLGKSLEEELFYKPKDLKKAHDRLVTDKQKLEAVKRLQEDPEKRQQEAAAMEEKFPQAAAVMREVKPKYEYISGEFVFRMPSTPVEIVEEGYALHHCAGSSERYFNRIANRETFIGFVRRASEPDIPYYTVEFEPSGTVRQNRSYYDEEPGIEEIRGFLKEWQREVKKRMTRTDWEDARRSEALREENLEELKRNRNTFVLNKLMEVLWRRFKWVNLKIMKQV